MRRLGYIADDPAAGITTRGDGRYEDDGRAVDIPTDAEIRAILAATETLAAQQAVRQGLGKVQAMIFLAVFTGMRPSEDRGLSWGNVEID